MRWFYQSYEENEQAWLEALKNTKTNVVDTLNRAFDSPQPVQLSELEKERLLFLKWRIEKSGDTNEQERLATMMQK